MKWLVTHPVRAIPLGLPLPMCETKSSRLLAQGVIAGPCSSVGLVANDTRLIREEIASARGTRSKRFRSDGKSVGGTYTGKRIPVLGPRSQNAVNQLGPLKDGQIGGVLSCPYRSRVGDVTLPPKTSPV